MAPSLKALREEAAHCTRCDLYKRGTQTVFGEGQRRARVMFVGEQPGDKEDVEGRPFVGPAGRLLDQALEAAGIDRDDVYVTNVVKHFKWEPRGKRRIHQKPNAREIAACRPWLDGEVAAIKPDIIVCLGATAAQALLGRTFKVTKMRGQPVPMTERGERSERKRGNAEPVARPPLARWAVATVHPSSVLRAPDDETRKCEMKGFFRDVARVRALLDSLAEDAAHP